MTLCRVCEWVSESETLERDNWIADCNSDWQSLLLICLLEAGARMRTIAGRRDPVPAPHVLRQSRSSHQPDREPNQHAMKTSAGTHIPWIELQVRSG